MDYIPTKNADFVAWLIAFSAAITAAPTAYGTDSTNATALAGLTTAVSNAWDTINDPATRTSVTIEAFNAARAAATASARNINNLAQALPATNTALLTAGLPVRDGTRTAQGPILESLDLSLVSALPEILIIDGRNSANPNSAAKPAGTGAIQIVMSIGEVPATDPAQGNDQRFFTKSRMDIRTDVNQRGKVVTIFGRYQSQGSINGQKVYGPWSMPLVLRLP